MRRRLTWLIGGWVVGTLTAAWLRRRVRLGVRRYAPARLRHEVADRSSALVQGIRRIAAEVAAAGRDGASEARPIRHALDPQAAQRRHRHPLRSVPSSNRDR